MIPVATLDPASLSVWYDPQLVEQMDDHQHIRAAVEAALLGDLDAVDRAVEGASDERARVRCLHLASAVWHEQRHFLDLVLTNYGGFVLRHFLQVYVNSAQVLHEQRLSGDPLHLPVTVYANDPEVLAALGIEAPTGAMLAMSRHIVRSGRALELDQQVVSNEGVTAVVGGHAQLEALAYVCQLAALQELFGLEAALAVQADLPEAQRLHPVHAWAFGFAPSEAVAEGRELLRVNLLLPLVIAALACRRWGQPPHEAPSGASSALPLHRLMALVSEHGDPREHLDLSPVEAWLHVNELCESLWGRSALAEIARDFELEAEWISQVAEHAGDDRVTRALSDLHALRGRFLAELQTRPEVIVDPGAFARELLPHLRPMPILIEPHGVFGQTPTGWEPLFAAETPLEPPLDRCWWAAMPAANDSSEFSLRDREAWRLIAETLAPLAKLMMHGRRHGTMLGPELLQVESALENNRTTLRFDRFFEYPDEFLDATFFYDLTGRSEAVCDICNSRIGARDGRVLSPWFFRRNSRAYEAMREEPSTEAEALLHSFDWSIWLVCDACDAKLRDIGAA